MTKEMTKSERRWRDGLGERYLNDGVTIRCQSVTKTFLKKMREEEGDPEISSDDVWPVGQCTKSAELGTFLCELHGGKTPNSAHNPLTMFLPSDLAEKLEILAQNPDYLSRYNEIRLLEGRNAQLYERLSGGLVLTPVLRQTITEIMALIRENSLVEAMNKLQSMLDTTYDEKAVYAEIRENMNLLKGMTTTQVTTAQVLKTMTTADSVSSGFIGLFNTIQRAVHKYIKEADIAELFLLEIAGDVRRYIGTGNERSSLTLGSGSIED
jgi:hypothetical protein